MAKPRFLGQIQNITVNLGREAVLECHVSLLGKYQLAWLKANDQTILTMHTSVVTNNERVAVDNEDQRCDLGCPCVVITLSNVIIAQGVAAQDQAGRRE